MRSVAATLIRRFFDVFRLPWRVRHCADIAESRSPIDFQFVRVVRCVNCIAVVPFSHLGSEMTTMTTIIGLMPVFLTQGRGSDVMQPMAIPSVGGMTVQLITLFIVPCLFCAVEEWKWRHCRDDRSAASQGKG